MTNAEKFYKIFGVYATELWAMPEAELLEWLNYEQKQTNADRIRAMTDEELAQRLYLTTCVHLFDNKVNCKDNGCEKCWLDWLKKGVE